VAIGSNRLRQLEAFALRFGEAIFIEPMAITVKSVFIDLPQQPLWGDFCQDIERVAQRLTGAFQSIQVTNGCQHMR
jgi:hypothetical protein